MNDRHSDFRSEISEFTSVISDLKVHISDLKFEISDLRSEYRIRLIDLLQFAWLRITSLRASQVLPDKFYWIT